MQIVFPLLVVFVAVGCAARPGAAATGTCEARRESAQAEIAAVIAAHQACEQDADCQSIAFQSGCFDSCSRAVNASGVANVATAIDKVNASTCANYQSDGCRVEIPPCVPPMPNQCIAGRCT